MILYSVTAPNPKYCIKGLFLRPLLTAIVDGHLTDLECGVLASP